MSLPEDIHQPEKKLDYPVVPCWLTKREYFAALAMQGLLASGCEARPNELAHNAAEYADGLIRKLDK